MKKIFTIFIISIFFCCTTDNKLTIEQPKLLKTSSKISDSSYYNNPNDIKVNKSNIYISDYDRSEILKLNDEFNYLKSIGNYGLGPGEINGAARMFFANDSIVLQNDNNVSFEFFHHDVNIKTLKLPSNLSSTIFDSDFLLYKDRLIFSDYFVSGSICSYNLNDDSYEIKGEIHSFQEYSQETIRNSRHLLRLDSGLILAVSDNLPIIEIYDSNLNALETFNYSNNEIVKETINVIDQKRINQESTYAKLIQDVCLDKNILYLLLITRNDNNVECNKILAIDFNSSTIKSDRIYSLLESWYSTMDVENGFLYTYAQTGERLEKYKL